MQPVHEGLAAALEIDAVEVAAQIQHAVGESLFHRERLEHAVLDGFLGDEIDHGDGTLLMLPPGTRNALLEFRGVPRQVAIDDHAGILQIQTGTAALGAEQDAAVRVLLERHDLGAAALLADLTGVQRVAGLHVLEQSLHEFQHAHPLGEDDDLYFLLC